MKIQIRTGMFETNSSSMHSLLIMKKRQIMTQQEIRDEFYLDEEWHKDLGNVIKLDSYDNDFGRSFDVLTSFRDKLNYAMASMLGNCYSLKSYVQAGDRFEEVFEPLLKKLVGVDEVKMPTDDKCFNVYSDSVTDDEYQDYEIYEEVPYEDLVYDEKREYGRYKEVCKSGRKQEVVWLDVPEFGSVDHASSGLLQRFMKKYGINLEDFLIRKDIVVIINGDENDILGRMIDNNLLNKEGVQIIFSAGVDYMG